MVSGGFGKSYVALLDGVPPERSGIIHTGMRRTAESIIVREVCPLGTTGSEEALTKYEVVEISPDGNYCRVLVTPVTGRTHQIRVHMASLGTPVFGDDLYGTSSPLIPRHALHAAALEFVHPITNEQIKLTSPLPSDMAELYEKLFK